MRSIVASGYGGAAQLRVVRLDQRLQRFPRHHLVHLRQENLPTRLLALTKIFRVTERQLHPSSSKRKNAIISDIVRVVQTFPR